MNNNLEIASACSTFDLCNNGLHITISFKETISKTEVFHFKTPRIGFSLLLPVSFAITQCRFF